MVDMAGASERGGVLRDVLAGVLHRHSKLVTVSETASI
jgi:hypothetical protein